MYYNKISNGMMCKKRCLRDEQLLEAYVEHND